MFSLLLINIYNAPAVVESESNTLGAAQEKGLENFLGMKF